MWEYEDTLDSEMAENIKKAKNKKQKQYEDEEEIQSADKKSTLEESEESKLSKNIKKSKVSKKLKDAKDTKNKEKTYFEPFMYYREDGTLVVTDTPVSIEKFRDSLKYQRPGNTRVVHEKSQPSASRQKNYKEQKSSPIQSSISQQESYETQESRPSFKESHPDFKESHKTQESYPSFKKSYKTQEDYKSYKNQKPEEYSTSYVRPHEFNTPEEAKEYYRHFPTHYAKEPTKDQAVDYSNPTRGPLPPVEDPRYYRRVFPGEKDYNKEDKLKNIYMYNRSLADWKKMELKHIPPDVREELSVVDPIHYINKSIKEREKLIKGGFHMRIAPYHNPGAHRWQIISGAEEGEWREPRYEPPKNLEPADKLVLERYQIGPKDTLKSRIKVKIGNQEKYLESD